MFSQYLYLAGLKRLSVGVFLLSVLCGFNASAGGEEVQISVKTSQGAFEILVDSSGIVTVVQSEFLKNCTNRAETRKKQCIEDTGKEKKQCLIIADNDTEEVSYCIEEFNDDTEYCGRKFQSDKKICQSNWDSPQCLAKAEAEKNLCVEEFENEKSLCLSEAKNEEDRADCIDEYSEEWLTDYCMEDLKDIKQLCGIDTE